jgi:hypothetical protein
VAEGSVIGNAWLAIKAKADPSFESDMKSEGAKGGSFFGDSFKVAAGNLMADAAKQLGGMVAEVFSEAFSNYANFEQLKGGIETLFGDETAKTVMDNAARAFESAGLSANQYMETVTSFSASMIQSLGGDTEAAAQMSNMAITDMADNANKMGTRMEEVQRAYQSMARGNFGMLDSLKLGYGGTRKEMERMLADAEKLTGKKYDISNFADITEAIHAIQEEMGIAGATAEEARGTIEGSINMLSASWQNFLTGLFDENADLGALGEQLFDSLGAVLQNVLPRIGILVKNLFSQLPGMIVEMIKELPSLIGPALEDVLGEELGGKASEALGGFVSYITETIIPAFQHLFDMVSPIIEKIAEVVIDVMPYIGSIIDTVMTGIGAVVDAVWPVIETVITTALDIIKGAIEGLAGIVEFVRGVFEGVAQAITNPIETAKNIIGGIVNAIKGFFSFKIELPHIPLPHFVVNPPGWQLGDLLKGQLPSLGIEWYAKGGIVDGPTLIGAGEAGPEAIIPLSDPNLAPFADAVASRIGGGIYIENMDVHADDVDGLIMSINRRLVELGAM